MEAMKTSWLRVLEVALLGAVCWCAGCANAPPPANTGPDERFESTRNGGIIDRERERPAARGGPITSMSVGPNSKPR